MGFAKTTPSPPRRQLTWLWVDLLWILLGIGGIFALGFLAAGWLIANRGVPPEEALKPSITQSLALAALEAVALSGGVYFLGIRRRQLDWNEAGFRRLSWGWVGAVVLATGIAIPLSALLTLLVLFAFGLPLENPQLDFLLPEGVTWLSGVGMFLLGGVAAPIGEELFFRGVLYTFIRERWGVWPAVSISSLIFAVVHGDVAVGVSALALGVIFALLFEYSRSLWAPVLAHVINNGAKIALLYLLVGLGFRAAL